MRRTPSIDRSPIRTERLFGNRSRLPRGISNVQWIQGEPDGDLWESLRGKVILLHFFSMRLSSNRRVLPHLKELHAGFHERGLEIISLHIAQDGGRVVA